MARTRLLIHIAACAFGLSLVLPLSSAWAFNENTSTLPPVYDQASCYCHTAYPGLSDPAVHGGYISTSKKCGICHDVHDSPAGGIMLLPGPTVKATCMTCHDGTQGRGVYGSLAARGLAVGAQHRIDTTNVVPGGNGATGGSATMTFSGPGGTLSCGDCHSVHASSVVATFTAERLRFGGWTLAGQPPTNNLLRQRPGNSASSTTVYGSDWCAACHRGRLSGLGLHTHPVDSKASTATPFYYENVARLTTDTPTSLTATGTLGRTNRGYLMPVPRTAQQQGHSPICQQCHEDSRNVGSLDPSGGPADAATFTVTGADGTMAGDNPRFQNFPHETANSRMLVEPGDDLCTNCHPGGILP